MKGESLIYQFKIYLYVFCLNLNEIPRGVESVTQIRTCVLEKLVGFFKDFLL